MPRYTIFFIVVSALHVSSGFSAHHQELKNCTCNIIYLSNIFAATVNVELKKTVEGPWWGLFSTAALRHIVLLPKLVPSFISRGAAHTKRRERPLLAKEGAITKEFS